MAKSVRGPVRPNNGYRYNGKFAVHWVVHKVPNLASSMTGLGPTLMDPMGSGHGMDGIGWSGLDVSSAYCLNKICSRF